MDVTVLSPSPRLPPVNLQTQNLFDSSQPQVLGDSSNQGMHTDIKESMAHQLSTSHEGVTTPGLSPHKIVIYLPKNEDVSGVQRNMDGDECNEPLFRFCFLSISDMRMPQDILRAWDPNRLETIEGAPGRWNGFFDEIGAQIALCEELC